MERTRHEMSAGMVARMMRELLARYRIRFVAITGGEPFLHKDCGQILKAMCFFRELGVISGAGVYTNAACFADIRRTFSVYGRNLRGLEMGVSIDGGATTHDRLRGAGSYQKTLKTVQWITENFGKKIVLEFKFTINKFNYAELMDVYRLAKQFNARFSPKIMEDGVSNYYHRRKISRLDQLASLTPSMKEDVRRQVSEIIKEGDDGINGKLLQALLALLMDGRKSIHACATPGKVLFINSRRDIYPCLSLSAAGKVGEDGKLPVALDQVRQAQTRAAAQGRCPGCFAYHGFLKDFNLPYLKK